MSRCDPVSPEKCMMNSIQNLHQGGGLLCPVVNEGEASMGEEGAGRGEEEAREVRAPSVPATPSKEEVMQHRLKHHPYRSWCPHCVRGKGREDRHTGSSQKDDFYGVPKIASDYFYIGQRRPGGRQEREEAEEEAELQ